MREEAPALRKVRLFEEGEKLGSMTCLAALAERPPLDPLSCIFGSRATLENRLIGVRFC